MKRFLTVLMLVLFALSVSACNEYQQPPKPVEPPQPAEPVVEVNYPPPSNVLIVDDDFSNLPSLDNVTTPVYDQYTIWERQEKGLPMELPYIEPYVDGKIAYLTFDDGPDDKNTPAVLDILQQEAVPGTFYVVGTQVEQFPDMLKRIYSEGHAIGNVSDGVEFLDPIDERRRSHSRDNRSATADHSRAGRAGRHVDAGLSADDESVRLRRARLEFELRGLGVSE